ncbi:MAG: hypothetical protein RLY86_2511 [Pseudomonadota bacterium]|jgi:CRISPR-associated endonuclease/helicase Cas3
MGVAFPEVFKHLTGYDPMPWQQRLAARMELGEIPAALDLPTGLGKTAVMAVWLSAHHRGASLPRRLVYVVDRRVIVDQATEEAERLAAAWRSLTGSDLPVSTLRGRHVDNRAWLEDPTRPAIIVGTVDMIGSRLLFQGYGVSLGMRPYQAGLLGSDSLIVLDEAHLCRPFQTLLRRLEQGTGLRQQPSPTVTIPGIRVLSLSATGDAHDDAVTLADEDLAHPVSGARLRAAKAIRIDTAASGLDDAMVAAALDLASTGPVDARIALFATSRDVAQKVADALIKRQKAGAGSPPVGAVLTLTGQRRVHERDKVAADLRTHGFLPPSRGDSIPTRTGPTFLVATAAGEVGVDLDADHAVMDLVAAERMIQRLGRVNRRGREGHIAQVRVIDAPWKGEPEALAELRARSRTLLERLPQRPDGTGQAADPLALVQLRAAEPGLLHQATTPAPACPDLDRPTLDAWSLTGIAHHPGRPDVQPWLRGWIEEEEPEVTLLWRAVLPWPVGMPEPPPALVEAWLDAAPPHPVEQVEVPRSQVLKLLQQRLDRCGLAEDEPAALLIGPDTRYRPGQAWTVGTLRSHLSQERERRRIAAAIAGGTLILSASLGGIDAQGLLNDNARGPRDGALRMAGSISAKGPGKGNDVPWPGCLDSPAEPDGENATPEAGAIPPMAETVGLMVFRVEAGDAPVARAGWRLVAQIALGGGDDGEETFLCVLARRQGHSGEQGDRAAARQALLLPDHLDDVTAVAGRFAEEFGLPGDHTRVLTAAAALHDLGKSRPLWQRAMGIRPGEIRAGRVYAKTAGTGANARLLDGYRHEFGSLFDADLPAHRSLLDGLPEDLRDLALHLVAAHHGHARPLITPFDPDRGMGEAVDKAREVALRFARLHAIWGPWGLAWWEALLRAADAEASRRRDAAAAEPVGETA